jgi:hypothetical protein
MFMAFLGTPTYVSINSTVNQQKLHFLTPPTHFFADVILEWSLVADRVLKLLNGAFTYEVRFLGRKVRSS